MFRLYAVTEKIQLENGKPNKGMQKWKYFIDQDNISI